MPRFIQPNGNNNVKSPHGILPIGVCNGCMEPVALATSKRTGGKYMCEVNGQQTRAFPWKLHKCTEEKRTFAQKWFNENGEYKLDPETGEPLK